jgi:enamine deaminase RidA (YjgF/YER057c/UK114 family)
MKDEGAMADPPVGRSPRQLLQWPAIEAVRPAGAQRGAWTPGRQRVGGTIRSGHLVFLGGIGGWYPERRAEAGDVRRQLNDALETMQASLERAGTSMANVLQVQVSLMDPERNWEGMIEVFNQFFPEPRPVLSCFGSAHFRRIGQLLQVDCIAYVE